MSRDRNAELKEKSTSSSTTADASAAEARTSDRDVPSPPEVPLGGAEWLAAAGAAYALNRLRNEEEDDSPDEES